MSADPLRAHARKLRRAKREREQPEPDPPSPEPGPLVSQGVRSEPPRRPDPDPSDALRAAAWEARARGGSVRIE